MAVGGSGGLEETAGALHSERKLQPGWSKSEWQAEHGMYEWEQMFSFLPINPLRRLLTT